MSLKLNTEQARKSDNFSSVIRETGKYVGVITRAEKLVSKRGTKGVGFSFKSDDGATANYLDVYTEKANGEELWGMNQVQSILACTKTRDAAEGPITFDKWTRDQGIVETTVTGYPALMGKRIGFLLQRELDTNPENGQDTDKVVIAGVFEADTGFTASEILDKKTKPEKNEKRLAMLKPVYDKRKNVKAPTLAVVGGGAQVDEFDDSIPF